MKHSILCVDDEVDNVEALERLFRRKYKVFKATSAEEALVILAKHQVTVIISDQRMPHKSGVEFLRDSIEIRPNAIRILLTGYTDIDSVIAAINSGQIYRYVTKPWDPVDLSNAIDKAVERYEIGEELIEKNRALQMALTELKSLDQAKNQFMVLVNHELKTPLTAILSFSELLFETKLDADQRLYLSRVKASTLRLQQMVNDVLEFLSAETAQMRFEIKSHGTQSLFCEDSLTDEIKQTASKRKVNLNHSIENQKVLCDDRLIRNVYRRLIHNAAKFADVDTEVEIRGRSTAANANRTYEISIRNVGPTIEADRLEIMLKPFTLNENVLNHTAGTGLGLSICQALLKLHSTSLQLTCHANQITALFQLMIDSDPE